MSDEVAKLGLAVDSSEVEQGTEKLKDFSEAANQAGESADKAKSKFVGLGSSASDAGGKFQDAGGGLAKTVEGAEKVGKAIESTAEKIKKAYDAINGASGTAAGLESFTRNIESTVKRGNVSLDSLLEKAKSVHAALAGSGGPPSGPTPPAGGGGPPGGPSPIDPRILGGLTLLTTATLAAAAAAGYFAYQWASAQEKIEQSLIGIGRRTGETIGNINKFSFDNATATGLSVDQAREAAIQFTRTGEISVSQLKGLGEAVHGFSVLTGKDATESAKALAKALSGDLVKGAQDLDKIYGALDGRTIEYIADLQASGQSTKAQQVIIDAMAEANKKAADSVDILTKSWDGFKNVLSAVKNAIPNAIAGGSLEDKLSAAKTRVSDLQTPSVGSDNQSIVGGQGSPELAQAQAALAGLQAQFDKIDASNALAQMQKLSTAADNVVKSIFPQIDQIRHLQKELQTLQAAQDNNGGFQGQSAGNDSAANAIRNQIAARQEALALEVRYNDAVAKISQTYQGLGQSAAIAVSELKNQLPIAQAVTGEAKMQAQYQASINSLAGQKMGIVAATAVADQQLAFSQAAATASVEKQVIALKDSTAMIRAQQNGTEATTAAAIAYKNAIASGADATAAAALRSATLQNALAKTADYSHQFEQSMVRAANAADSAQDSLNKAAEDAERAASAAAGGNFGSQSTGGFGGFDVKAGTGHTSGVLNAQGLANLAFPPQSAEQTANLALSSGGLNSAITSAQNFKGSTGLFGKPQPDFGLVQSLFELKNAQTNDNSLKTSNLQAEIAWLQTQPETIARDQQIVSLMRSIDSLKNSVDANTQVTLNPLYSQGHAAIGYFHAASGLDMIAQGPSVGDSIPFHAMVNGGERITIGPANQTTDNRSSRSTNLVQNIIVSGQDSPPARRNALQRAQGFVAAAG